MKRMFWIYVFVVSLMSTSQLYAGATLQVGEEGKIDLGFRLQTLAIGSNSDDVTRRDQLDYKVRRARLRVRGDVNSWLGMFIQTEFGEDATAGSADARIIDAYIHLNPNPLIQIFAGENMAPALRQNLTSSGALMAMDRPAINYKSLNWGTRAVGRFANSSLGNTDAGLDGAVDVRDMGVTLFGSSSWNDEVHYKYYLGTYDGADSAARERFTGRIQVNFGDAESGYYNSSTYFGGKDTIGIGISYDFQSRVAKEETTSRDLDYALYSIDAFAEKAIGPGALTCEAAYINLDLDNGQRLTDQTGTLLNAAATTTTARQSEGDGYYFQAGYTYGQWQPWVGFETWDSKSAGNNGGFESFRVGVTRLIDGHHANIKLGYERLRTAQPYSGNEDVMDCVVAGLYITY